MPKGKIYRPLQVGYGEDIKGFLRDNSGQNISEKNKDFSELTGLYWIWKNCDSDVKGLVHYRRLFTDGLISFGSKKTKYRKILKEKTIKEIMLTNDMILPRKRNYYIQSLYSHYSSNHDPKVLDITRKIIQETSPDYLSAFDEVINGKSAHMFNMFIARSDIFNSYSEWLFGILFELEHQLKDETLLKEEGRIPGYVSEFLMDVWIKVNKPKYQELPVAFIEGQNYLLKGSRMITQKILSKVFKRPL